MFNSIGNMFKKKQDVKKEEELFQNMSQMDTNDKTDNQYSAIFSKIEDLNISMKHHIIFDEEELFIKFFEEKIKNWK
jgi:hypothetical protein